MKTFEDYLRSVWPAEGVLDDDTPDRFDSWLAELDVSDVMDYAEAWGAAARAEAWEKARAAAAHRTPSSSYSANVENAECLGRIRAASLFDGVTLA